MDVIGEVWKYYPIKDPYRQGTQQKKEIVGQIVSHPKWPKGAKFVAGHSAFFPDVDNPKQWSLPHAAPDITGWKTDLMQLRSWVESHSLTGVVAPMPGVRWAKMEWKLCVSCTANP